MANYRLKGLAIATLVFAATVADLTTLIPFVGDFVGPIYWVVVTLFLYLKGFRIMNVGRFATSAISVVAEVIPMIQWLPTILAGTVIVIVISRIEDKAGIKIQTPKGQLDNRALVEAVRSKAPLNQGGVRRPTPEIEAPDMNMNEKTPRQPLNVDGVRRPGNNKKEDLPLAA